MNTLDQKEAKLKEEFDNEQKEALKLEEQITELQKQHQKKIINMTRIQGAVSLIKELRAEKQ